MNNNTKQLLYIHTTCNKLSGRKLVFEYYPSGQIRLEDAFVNNKQTGLWKHLYPSDNIVYGP